MQNRPTRPAIFFLMLVSLAASLVLINFSLSQNFSYLGKVLGRSSLKPRVTVIPTERKLIITFPKEVDQQKIQETLTVSPAAIGNLSWPQSQMLEIEFDDIFRPKTVYAVNFYSSDNPDSFFQYRWQNGEVKASDESQNQTVGIKTAKVPILMFHNVGRWNLGESRLQKEYKIEPKNLDAMLSFLAQKYEVISLERLNDYFKNNIVLPEKPVIITFDDGWRGVYDEAFPILKKYNLPFTVFLITSHYEYKSAYLSRSQIQEMLMSGLITLGNHTANHLSLGLISKSEVEREIAAAQEKISEDFGIIPSFLAYPGGSYTKQVKDVVRNFNFQMALTVEPGAFHAADKLFELKRIAVSGLDDVEKLAAKLKE